MKKNIRYFCRGICRGISRNSGCFLFCPILFIYGFSLFADDYDKILKDASAALKRDDYACALKLAGEVISAAEPHSEKWNRGVEILSRANSVIYSNPKIPDPKKFEYIVRSGDTLEILAKDFGVTAGAVLMNNSMPPDAYIIPAGKKLVIYAGQWKIRISKKYCRLYLYNDGKLFKACPVTVGRNGKTPSGDFEIASKVIDPDWLHEGKIYPFGSKEHPLGTRWMNLRPAGETDPGLSGYGLHGTWRPERIGRAESNGCIRMKNEDIEELFEIVPYKTPVTIED